MRALRAAGLLFVVATVVAGLVALWIRAGMLRPEVSSWCVVWTPSFGSRTNGTSICPTVSFTVSNAGPRTLDYEVKWYECRAMPDLTVLATCVNTNLKPGQPICRQFPRVPLRAGATAQITTDLAPSVSGTTNTLFCAYVYWEEHHSLRRRLLEKSDDLAIWVLDIFDRRWNRRWHPAYGSVFTSNVKGADYFRLVYGADDAAQFRYEARNKGFIEMEAATAFGLSTMWTNAPQLAEPAAAPIVGPASPLAIRESAKGHHR
jgi:hypothetical protein